MTINQCDSIDFRSVAITQLTHYNNYYRPNHFNLFIKSTHSILYRTLLDSGYQSNRHITIRNHRHCCI